MNLENLLLVVWFSKKFYVCTTRRKESGMTKKEANVMMTRSVILKATSALNSLENKKIGINE